MANQSFISWTDCQKVDPLIDSFDYKRDLPEYDFAAVSSNWALSDCGEIGRLYRDGVDLGAAESLVGDVDADGEWFYDSASDKLTINSTNDANTYRWQAAQDTEANMKTADMNDGAEMAVAELADRFPSTWERRDLAWGNLDYDYPFAKLCALMTVIKRREACDPGSEATNAFKEQLTNELGTGLLDRIKAGEIKFSFEVTESDKQGEIVACSGNDSTTTGYPYDTLGTATELYGEYRITIGTGGTLAFGTENTTITYSVTDANGETLVDTEYIDGSTYNTVGGGISVLFKDGKYVADDCWTVYTRGRESKTSVTRTINLQRL